jgi:hypothetical protein
MAAILLGGSLAWKIQAMPAGDMGSSQPHKILARL